jgi:hypothetical protein
MEKKNINPETKDIIPEKEQKVSKSTHNCCGGDAVTNTNACCKADEDKKANGETGCDCNSASSDNKSSACC